ncbi:choice-of-anchor J domain-containing protein [uncultured Winogradskyella sp.]|uniref:T9SS-dependent choice-of-anchor J family protein n=1 Tax=uncultured Winogradskyella sp. TaxID=395353 RepID=UPI0026365AD6|nr:choice-of-anchor J domain-containing protein [uncultured Winogradskyella sp.]
MMKKITLLTMLSFAFVQLTMAQTILTEGFEGATFPPTGWTTYIGTNGLGTAQNWIQTSTSNTGSGAAFNRYENVSGGIAEDWLVTSQIDLTSATNAELLFYSAQTYGTNYGSNYEVKVSTSSQTTHSDFTTVASYDETNVGGAYTLQTVDLSAYDGMMIYIAFVHLNDDGDNWFIDDIEVRSPLSLDAKLNGVNLNRYALTSTDNQLSTRVNNNGLSTITSLDITWNDGTNNYSENFNVNIAPGETQTIVHSSQVNYSSVEEKTITVTIDSVNGGADGDSSNNSINTNFNTMTQSGTKAVLIEESTGTWCGWCPRGTVGLDYMTTTYPNNVVGVAVHYSDPMTDTEYDTGLVNLIGSGWPNSGIDRNLLGVDPGQASLQSGYDTQITQVVPVDLSSGATQVGNTLTISAQASFYTSFNNSDFRLGVIITEDGVTGTGDGTNVNNSDYDQVNYYAAGSGNGVMGGYENYGDPKPATDMIYNHVGRAILGGFNGQDGSVPTIINVGDNVSYDFTYAIPATSDVNNMNIVVILIDGTNGGIVSAQQSSVAQALSVEEVSGASSIKIYPNPAKDNINIALQDGNGDYNITVTDMLGRTVINESYKDLFGNQNVALSVAQLNAGHYIMNINDGNASYSTKFIVTK